MTRKLTLPDVGEGIAEAELLEWLVSEGETVEEDQPVAEVETDKAAVEVPSPVDGTVTALHAEEGEIVQVGETIVTFDVEGEGVDEPEPGDTGAIPAGGEGPESDGDDEDGDGDRGAAGAAGDGETTTAAGNGASREPADAAGGRDWILAVPRTRHLARELGVDIDEVPATEGRDGEAVVTEEAVRAYAERQSSEATDRDSVSTAAAGDVRATSEGGSAGADTGVAAGAGTGGDSKSSGERETRVPYRGIRRTIGEQMERSKYTAPHVSHFDIADAETLVETREELGEYADERGVRLTYSAFILKAAATALQEFPYMNATLDEEREEIVLKEYYNLGFATATGSGLLVPVIEDVDRKSLLEVATEMDDLAERAREGSITRQEMQGGTFTVTNVGNLGGEFATPIINYPEVAILGVGAIRRRPRVVGQEVRPRQTAPLSVSFDHRVVDGATVARFTTRVVDYLEEPSLFLLD